MTLTNELGVDVARGICHSVKADLVIDSVGMSLGNDCVAVQIAESLVEDEVPSEWMFSMRVWHIYRVFLNRASLYDHDQRHIYNAAVQALNRRPRRDVRQYDPGRERQDIANFFFRTITMSLRFSRLLWMTSNHHRLSLRLGYHYFRMFQFGFWAEHSVTIYL
jgi:hypothetical protein